MRYSSFRAHALSLADVIEAPHFDYASFRVGSAAKNRIFVTVPPDQLHVHVFADEPEREIALATQSDCCEKLFWGSKVLGLKVRLADAPSAWLKTLVSAAHAHKAAQLLPKRRAP